MIRRLYRLWPHPRPMVRFASMEAALAVLQGLLLGALVPILSALLRPEPDFAAATPWLVAGAAGFAVYVVLSVLVTPAGFAASNELGDQQRRLLMRHVTTLPLGWFDASRKADFVRTVSAAGHLATITVVVGGPVLSCVLVPTTIIGVTFAVDWRLALVLLVLAPVAFLLARRSKRITMSVVSDIEVAAREIVGRTIEFGQAQPVLRAAGTARSGTAQLGEALTEHRRRYARGLNRLLLPDLSYTGVGALDVAVSRVERILHTPELPRAANPRLRVPDAGIEFRGVTFAYAETPVLRDVSFHCPPGTTTALVGPSGSGKTTVTRLVARFADVAVGEVRVGGVDVREYDHATLLREIAIVFQDVYLFDTTIEENLRIASPGATDAELAAAARAARLDEVIERLPDGWATRVGEAGAQLSGGERQRVSIARAFLKQAPIVLIDEAASALDPENEGAIGAAIAALATDPHRTVLVIAHRPATLAAADQVIALDDGRVAEAGSPAELRGTGGALDRIHAQYEHARSWHITAS